MSIVVCILTGSYDDMTSQNYNIGQTKDHGWLFFADQKSLTFLFSIGSQDHSTKIYNIGAVSQAQIKSSAGLY